MPGLRFEVTSLFEGVDCLLIGFLNEAGMDRFEVLRFRDGLVIEGHGTYPAEMTGQGGSQANVPPVG
ncbi:MAG TPA: hypothetical protein VNT42_00080 [Sphingomonas sp.]|nr:hypothetical protein [Sphingomonas sp.]